MAQISKFGPLGHIRSEPNEFVLHFRSGRVVRSGAGLSFFFNPLSASVAQLPVEDCEATFVLRERASDFQEVSVQVTITYRIADHARAASRVNFSISLTQGTWLERPLERLAALWAQKALEPVRRFVAQTPIVEVVQRGAERIRGDLDAALRADAEIAAIGLQLVTAQVAQVAPTADLEKAMQTPTREALQQKADEAVFARRALAVEKERAIKENELATELELARRQTQLIEQRGANALREIEQAARNARAQVEAETERAALVSAAEAQRALVLAEGEARKQAVLVAAEGERRIALATADAEAARLATEAYARDLVARAAADADGARAASAAALDAETNRVALWREAPQRVASAFAMQTAASKLANVNHLNLTPDLIRTLLQEFATDRTD
jgi:regulator of protease activity HflC (stomatin/prohibitin superfamily)